MITAPYSQEIAALLALGRWLQARDYCFTTVTPATQARVNARAGSARASDLRDIFGWSRPFAPVGLDLQALGWLRSANLLSTEPDGMLRSQVRFSSLGELLFAHSAYPTSDADAVFFGPDTVRFAALIEAELLRMRLPDGARNYEQTYIHIVVCWLEIAAMTQLVGKERARALCDTHWGYRWIYRTVRRDSEALGDLLTEHGLWPMRTPEELDAEESARKVPPVTVARQRTPKAAPLPRSPRSRRRPPARGGRSAG